MIVNQLSWEKTGEIIVVEKQFEHYTNKQLKKVAEFKLRVKIFLEVSDRFDDGKQKYKEAIVLKKAGGRYKEGLCKKISCKNIFGCFVKRYFMVN